MAKSIFVNLPVKDLDKTVTFFTALGFEFNPQFTDENATCMLIGENMYAMLLVEPFFKTFTSKEIADATQTTEVILSLGLESREDVTRMVEQAKHAGGTIPREPQDYGWMFQWGFADLDGHLWEVAFMDENAIPEDPTV